MTRSASLVGFGLVLGLLGGIIMSAGSQLCFVVWALAVVFGQVGIIGLGVSVGIQDARERDAKVRQVTPAG